MEGGSAFCEDVLFKLVKSANLEPGVRENESSSQVVHCGFAGDKQDRSSRQNFHSIFQVVQFILYKSLE